MISLLSTKLLAIAAIVATIWPQSKSTSAARGDDQRPEHDEMDDEADAADQREQHEAGRQHAAARVVGDEAEEIEADERRKFRFARLPLAEHIGRLDDLQLAGRGEDEVDEDLEAVRRQTRREPGDDLAPRHEEAAHRVGDVDAGDAAKEPGAEIAELLARRREAAGRRFVGDARADGEVAFARGERRVHFRQDALRRAAGRRRSRRRNRRSRTASPR